MKKVISIIKIILVSVIFLVGLTYLTSNPPKQIENKDILLKELPKTVNLVGYENREFNTNSIIKEDTIIFVGNFESLAIANDFINLAKDKNKNIVVVSNISDAPWFIKKWQAHDKSLELRGDTNIPWIYDKDGAIRYFLQIKSSEPLKYTVFKVLKDKIKEIYQGSVVKGTIDGKMSKDDIKNELTKALNKIGNNDGK